MKIPLLSILFVSLSLVRPASAQDDERPAPVRDRESAPVQRHLEQPAAVQNVGAPRQEARVPAGGRVDSATPQAGRPRFNRGVNVQQPSAPRVIPGLSGINPSVVQPATGQPSAAAPAWAQYGGRRNPAATGQTSTGTAQGGGWRRRRPDHATPLADQIIRDGGATTSDSPRWQNRPNGGSAQDWRNRRTGGDSVTDDADGTNHSNDWRHRTPNNGNWHDRNDGDGTQHGWDRHRHHRDWWRSRYSRFALFGGGYYYWNSGSWYPAYGYDPYFSTYTYDAPIYGYNDLPPAQVLADVQAELARRGYYDGAVDGVFGPATRAALQRFQRDAGLRISGAIDEETLDALGYN